ncbi:dihydropteroate synthase [Citricoccus alkalitolerans]|uniref:Dihydropteroate synthase n=1 Tax=Citricoccus alkalitolerans TaxID=246603 RepID=A0ABV8XUI0_9MICC
MDSMAAQTGTGPNTGPLSVVRKVRRRTLRDLPTDRTLIMGVVNVTHNSFSDGGEYLAADAAIEQGLRLHYAGADIIDVGGESTRPGAEAIDPVTEQNRILPVVEALVKAGAVVSVDTMHTVTAEAALRLGDVIINDVSGLNYEPEMPELIARTGATYVLMHNRGDSKTMDSLADYGDVVEDVTRELTELKDAFLAAGVQPAQLILDPGLGFAKAGAQNWELLKGLDRLQSLGFPVLVAASRKRFLGTLLANEAGAEPAPADRDHATAAVSALSALSRVWGVRVHEIEPSLHAVKTARAWLDPESASTRRRGA